ncbi:hypothetical protein J6E39_07955, partial [bacterium]|nr:hypothetical protein [bacterium]
NAKNAPNFIFWCEFFIALLYNIFRHISSGHFDFLGDFLNFERVYFSGFQAYSHQNINYGAKI